MVSTKGLIRVSLYYTKLIYFPRSNSIVLLQYRQLMRHAMVCAVVPKSSFVIANVGIKIGFEHVRRRNITFGTHTSDR